MEHHIPHLSDCIVMDSLFCLSNHILFIMLSLLVGGATLCILMLQRWALYMICRISEPMAAALHKGRAFSFMPHLKDAYEIVFSNIYSDCIDIYHVSTFWDAKMNI